MYIAENKQKKNKKKGEAEESPASASGPIRPRTSFGTKKAVEKNSEKNSVREGEEGNKNLDLYIWYLRPNSLYTKKN